MKTYIFIFNLLISTSLYLFYILFHLKIVVNIRHLFWMSLISLIIATVICFCTISPTPPTLRTSKTAINITNDNTLQTSRSDTSTTAENWETTPSTPVKEEESSGRTRLLAASAAGDVVPTTSTSHQLIQLYTRQRYLPLLIWWIISSLVYTFVTGYEISYYTVLEPDKDQVSTVWL